MAGRGPETSNTGRRAPWAVVAWCLLWQLGSMALGSELLLPSPLAVAARFIELLPQASFWGRMTFTLGRVAAGFALASVAGIACALAASRRRGIEDFLAPAMALAKSVPVASITVLALIWLRAAKLAVLVVLLVVLPLVYGNALQGLRAADRRLDEVADLYRIGPWRRLRFFTMPVLYPYLKASLVLGFSTAWKAATAAEVIGIPAGSLGEAVYDAKVGFDTPGLFAVTLAIVIASSLCGALLRRALDGLEPLVCGAVAPTWDRDLQGGSRALHPDAGGTAAGSLELQGVSKGFAGHRVLDGATFSAAPGAPVCIMAPSGSGKTTLLRIVAGLERPDAGTVSADGGNAGTGGYRVSMAFQDDRLADRAGALVNVRLPLAAGSPEWDEAPRLLDELGLGECARRPAGSCSGGERRRIGLARALLAPHEVLLLDEPFAGLDDETRMRAARIVREREAHAVVVLASHDERDAELLGARVIGL